MTNVRLHLPLFLIDAAACRDVDEPDVFFLPDPAEKTAAHPAALAMCAGCTVRVECLAWALRHEPLGVWGGVTPEQRRAMGGVYTAALSPLHLGHGRLPGPGRPPAHRTHDLEVSS